MSKWIVWTNIETNGPDPLYNKILQIACILTNFETNIRYEMDPLTLHCNLQDLYKSSHVTEVTSELMVQCMSSKLTIGNAQRQIVEFIYGSLAKECISDIGKTKLFLGGTNVYTTRLFLNEYMPELTKLLEKGANDINMASFVLICDHHCPEIKDIFGIAYRRECHTESHKKLLQTIDEYDFYKRYCIRRTI